MSCSGLEPDSDTSRRYYIGKYRASSWSPVGRGTRVYVAYDQESNEIVMLKDSWCVVGADASVLNEFEVLKEFLRAGIKHVPTVVAGGFVDGATTASQEFIKQQTGVAHGIRQNMRFAVKEVGRSIDTFNTPRELVQAIYSAFKGMLLELQCCRTSLSLHSPRSSRCLRNGERCSSSRRQLYQHPR